MEFICKYVMESDTNAEICTIKSNDRQMIYKFLQTVANSEKTTINYTIECNSEIGVISYEAEE